MNLFLRNLLFYIGIIGFLFRIVNRIKKNIISVKRKFVDSLEAL